MICGFSPGRPPENLITSVCTLPTLPTSNLATTATNSLITMTTPHDSGTARFSSVHLTAADTDHAVGNTRIAAALVRHGESASVLDPQAPPFESRLSRSCGFTTLASGQDGSKIQGRQAVGMDTRESIAARKWLYGEPVRPRATQFARQSGIVSESLLPLLPFMDDPDLTALAVPARPVLRANSLKSFNVQLPHSK